jgi:hypothetical protein
MIYFYFSYFLPLDIYILAANLLEHASCSMINVFVVRSVAQHSEVPRLENQTMRLDLLRSDLGIVLQL